MAFIGGSANRREFYCCGAVAKLLYIGVLASVVTACGMKGDLYLPEASAPAEQAAAADNPGSGKNSAGAAETTPVSNSN